MINPIKLRLSSLRALWGHVTSDLRAVCIKEEHQDVIVVFFCDELSEELEDSAQVTTTEIISDIPEGENHYLPMIETLFVCEAYPKPMALFEHLVYLRYEEGCDRYRELVQKESFSIVNLPNLRLSGQRALLGRVTPNLRRIAIVNKDNNVRFYFYYDGEIADLERRLAHDALREVRSDFSLATPPTFDLLLVRTDFPERIFLPDEEGCWLYVRYEK